MPPHAAESSAPLAARFCRLFSLVTVAVAVGVVLQALDGPASQRLGAVAAAAALTLWAFAMRRFGDRSRTVDLLGFAPMAAAGLLVSSPLNLFPLLFAVALQRGVHTPPRRARVTALVSVGVWLLTRTHTGVAARFGTVVALGVILLGATAFAGTVRREADRRDLATRREQRLLESVRTMAALQDPREVLQQLASTAVALVERPDTSAVVWEEDGDVFRAVASYGTTRTASVPVTHLPGQVLHVFETGQPTVLEGAVARELQHVGEASPRYPAYVMVPLTHRDGQRVALLLYCTVSPDGDLLDLLRRFAVEVGLAEERAVLHHRLAEREARLSSIMDHSSDVIALLDADGRFTLVNGAAERRFGHRVDDVLGRSVFGLIHPDDRAAVNEAMLRVLPEREDAAAGRRPEVHIACRMRTAEGEWRQIESQLTTRAAGGFVLNARDVTERQALEAEIVHRAFHDPLTDLANRALFFDRLEHAIERGRRDGHGVAVLMIDLDDFKPVNDTYGHAIGDDVLVEVAARLRAAVRESDTAARLGGDEFAVLLEGVDPDVDVAGFAERLRADLAAPMQVGAHEVRVSASVGAAASLPGEHHNQLMRRADDALYVVKFGGKGRSLVGDPG